ncbi:UNVERIFIED_CONTAM: hypothetical protein GTU68_065617 [Idotea baltica]|nr:hypothetical protein [Idotea baltica]
MNSNPAQALHAAGQSVWYDNISRELIQSGELKRLVNEWGVRGLTSNPSIFDAALKEGDLYDLQIASLKGASITTSQVFEELALSDIGDAADLLKPIYDESNGEDGYCSIEVSPTLARDTKGTIVEGKRLYSRLERKNIMVKIPGTQEGLPAIRACLEAGININVTLLFSVENYIQVAQTYCEALSARLERGESISEIRSVASFFVSRVDVDIDSKLEKAAGGRFGIANSVLAYKAYQDIFESPKFDKLRKAGAAVQRPLWASTGTKNPEYRDVLYVEELIGADTVNTLPHKTLAAFVDHGKVKKDSIMNGVEAAAELREAITALGINIPESLEKLQDVGVDKFVASFDALHASLEAKL